MRVIAWLGVIALASLGVALGSIDLRVAAAFLALGLFALSVPRVLQPAMALTVCAAIILLLTLGAQGLLEGVPELISTLVSWLFARTLLRGRRPLIARAIAAIDGEQQLQDYDVVRYARNLTLVWSIYQAALALLLALLWWNSHTGVAWLPSAHVPGWFGAIVLPVAVALLFTIEFALRPVLLPHVPRHRLWSFTRRLIDVWPQLLND